MSSSSQITATFILAVFIAVFVVSWQLSLDGQLEQISENTAVLKDARVERHEPVCSTPAPT